MEENSQSISPSDDDNEDSTSEKTSQWQQVRSGKREKTEKEFNHEQTVAVQFYKSTQEKTTCRPEH